jgi:predicted AAA+ superfamily ATPase
MDNQQINRHLLDGDLQTGVLPHVDNLKSIPFVFEQDFGLSVLPSEPGIILVRGPRQYGKSTWLEQQIALTVKQFGKGTALYLNGDEIKDVQQLMEEIRVLLGLFVPNSKIKRLFIDEITAVLNWQKAIKRLADAGELNEILLVTTGSKASDLRRGVERLPGRKGKLARTNYIFTPISYKTFKDACGDIFKEDTLFAYILSGGSPIGANALASTGRLPEYVISIMSDWIFGEFSAAGRSRAHLLAMFQSLYRMACTPIGQAKLARESGFANNTVAHEYIELLSDLMTVIPAFPYDIDRKITLFRKPCKYHFINLLMAICWHPKKPRTIEELKQLGQDLGAIFEWTVAQEIWRRACIKAPGDLPDFMNFWQSKEREIDFVLPDEKIYVEVKAGKSSPIEFTWFPKCIQSGDLTVVNQSNFEATRITGLSLEDYLLSD